MYLLESRLTFRILLIGLALSLVGAAVLFSPTLEFMAADIIDKTRLPIGLVSNLAIYSLLALFAISTLGLIAIGLRRLISRTR